MNCGHKVQRSTFNLQVSPSNSITINSMPFYDGPIEVVEQIIVAIDEPRDLLSLGLCSKALYGLIFPYHIQLRRVKCDVLQDDFWEVLSNYPHLAKLVRRLQIVRLGSELVKKNPIHPLVLSKTFSLIPLSSLRLSEGNRSASLPMLLTAIGYMNLTEFSWNSDISTYIHPLTVLRTVFRCNRGLRNLRLIYFLKGREASWDYSPLAVRFYFLEPALVSH